MYNVHIVSQRKLRKSSGLFRQEENVYIYMHVYTHTASFFTHLYSTSDRDVYYEQDLLRF